MGFGVGIWNFASFMQENGKGTQTDMGKEGKNPLETDMASFKLIRVFPRLEISASSFVALMFVKHFV